MLGGGGYTIRNVARCWTYETAVALDTSIPNGESFMPLKKKLYYAKLHIYSSAHKFIHPGRIPKM